MYQAITFVSTLLAIILILNIFKNKSDESFSKFLKILTIVFCVLGFFRFMLSDSFVYVINGGYLNYVKYDRQDILQTILRWGYYIGYSILPMAVFFKNRFFRNIASYIFLPFAVLSAVFINDYMGYFLSPEGNGLKLVPWIRYTYFIVELVIAMTIPVVLQIKEKHVLNIKDKKELIYFFVGIPLILLQVMPVYTPQSLFGYYNSIENKFEPTELLRALYQMQPTKNSKKGGQMLMVLLDEMNLAHVELYFSDLLSKFETRRGSNSPVEYEISLGAGADSELLQIGTNVLWTGTMNEDETTKALSDKVVDRSTLITFPRPKKLIGRNKNVNQKTKYVLDKEQWSKWLNSAINIEQIDQANMDDMQDTVERINAKMSELGRNLGHRVWQGIQNYIVNYPDVISSTDEAKRREAIQKAFSEAVAFKIMPKLRGVEVSGEYEDIVDDIAKIIQDKIPELINDFTRAKSLPSKLFMWHSAEFLEN
jgi:hypothetical protein